MGHDAEIVSAWKRIERGIKEEDSCTKKFLSMGQKKTEEEERISDDQLSNCFFPF